MGLQIFNSLSGKKEAFVPIDQGKVRIYVCGMTVYDYCHIGHARVLVVFDVIVRYLRAMGFDVTYVRNITDVDDKIIRRAHEQSLSIEALTRRYIQAMHEDASILGVLPPDREPRATRSMEAIIKLIAALIRKGFAYQAANGDVYYDVSCFASYGALSGKQLDELRVGARVEVSDAKDDPLDFVLWKVAKPDDPRWDSPWGPGRPGWHIECSAMATTCLGSHFDIHGGGMALKFPHHENEIAQSEGATGCKFVNYWIHNGFVQVDDEKMSKSLGNFFTVREVLRHVRQPEIIRYFILASHYRSPLNYSSANLASARAALGRFYLALRGTEPSDAVTETDYAQRFHEAMQDDFNTPEALAVLFDLARELNKAKTIGDRSRISLLAAELRRLGGLLGILQHSPEDYLQTSAAGTDTAAESAREELPEPGVMDETEVEALIVRRNRARQDKDWPEADRIRDLLKEHGIMLEDGASGTLWRRA